MPILTVDQYRELAQVADEPPSDLDIELALARFTSIMESYLQRAIALSERSEMFFGVADDPIHLSGYPVDAVLSLTVDGADVSPSEYRLHPAAGLLYHRGALIGHDVEVIYDGGYEDAPYDLKTVLATLTLGYLQGVSGGVNAIQAVRKETVMGVSSVEYLDPGLANGGYGTPYAELGPYVSILDRYRAVSLA
jgi:hypothetical protein